MTKAKINEIFDSIQGEGPYIGYRQLFIRFCNCNLMCDYCDTNFVNGVEYDVNTLIDEINKYPLKNIHSVSLTGGEPLLQYEFLKEFLPLLKDKEIKIYLETNGVLHRSLSQVVDFVDIVSMDIKLDSCAKVGDLYSSHKEFLKVAKTAQKEIFAKIVFDENIRDFEIDECVELAKTFDIQIILQPKMIETGVGVSHDKIVEIFNKFSSKYKNVRLIGQVHKFFDIR